jgi:hypothetical protein
LNVAQGSPCGNTKILSGRKDLAFKPIENDFGALGVSPTPKVTAASSLMKWLLAIVMTAIVTRILLFLAVVFQSKVSSEADAEKVRFAEGLNPHQPVQRPVIPPRGEYQTLLSCQQAEVVYDLIIRSVVVGPTCDGDANV